MYDRKIRFKFYLQGNVTLRTIMQRTNTTILFPDAGKNQLSQFKTILRGGHILKY